MLFKVLLLGATSEFKESWEKIYSIFFIVVNMSRTLVILIDLQQGRLAKCYITNWDKKMGAFLYSDLNIWFLLYLHWS